MVKAILFDSGSAELKKEALPIIEKVALILERYADNTIEIEGHTDNIPIHNNNLKYFFTNIPPILLKYNTLVIKNKYFVKQNLKKCHLNSIIFKFFFKSVFH